MITQCAVWVATSNLRRIRRRSGKLIWPHAKPTEQGGPEQIELEINELESILERVRASLTHEQ